MSGSVYINYVQNCNVYNVLQDECCSNVDNDNVDNVNHTHDAHDIVEDDLCNNIVKSRPTIRNAPGKKNGKTRRPVRRSRKRKRNVKDNNVIKIAFNNLRGLKSKNLDVKHFITSNNIQITGLVETFLKEHDQVKIKGYNWVGKNRKKDFKKSQGGIGFLIKDNIQIVDDNVLESKIDSYERLWIKVQLNESPDSTYFIATAYFPCEGTDRPLTDEIYVCLMSEILQIQQHDEDAKIIVMGDFNGKIGNNPRNEDKDVDYNGNGLLDLCDATDLTILNLSDKCTGVYTWFRNHQKGVLDYICVSQSVLDIFDSMLIDEQAEFHLGSDHNMLLVDLKQNISNDHRKSSNKTVNENLIWNIKNDQNWEPFQKLLSSKFTDWDPINMSANEAWNNWKDKVIFAAKESIGTKTKKKYGKQWFDSDILAAINARKQACRDHRNYTKKSGHEEFDSQVRDSLWDNYQKKRIDCKSLIKQKIMQMRVDRCSEIMKKGGPQSKDFWSQLKGGKPINKVTSIVIPGTNQTTSDKEVMKTSIMMYYNTLGKMNHNLRNDNDENDIHTHFVNDQFIDVNQDITYNKIDKLSLSIEDVLESISNCKNNKSPGSDMITNELLKNGGNAMASSLFKLFKRLSILECIPDQWNEGIIVPIFKKGDARNLDNYRGITLTSCVSKVYNRILAQTVSKFVEDNNILTDIQGSFRKDRRCEDHVFTLKSICATRKAEGKNTFLAFLDFKKAFDTVYRKGLFKAIKSIGIEGSLLNIIMNLYSNVKSKVRFQDFETELFNVDEGVKQGCVLSPIIFCIYINELAKLIKSSNLGITIFGTKIGCLFWADDVVLIGENENDLQKLLDVASDFSNKWKMCYNYDKSNVLITGQRVNVHKKWKLCNNFIKEVNEYKYLGVILNRNQSDNSHIDEVLKRGNRIIAYIKSIIDNQENFNRIYYGTLLWQSIGLSSINCACATWFCNGKSVIDKLENLQYNMARTILKAPRNVAKDAMYGDLGWQTMYSIQNNIRVQYFNRLKQMDEDRLPKLLLNAIFHVEDNLKWGWLCNINSALVNCDMQMYYNCNNEYDNWSYIFKCKNKVKDQIEWKERILKKSSLDEYNKHKDIPCLEPYLLDKLNFNGVSLKFKARTNSLNLENKKKIWNDQNTGMCKMCNLNEIENVDHFMFKCSSLRNVRFKHFKELEESLNRQGWRSIWIIFNEGDLSVKHHLLLDNIFIDNFELGTILDNSCKSLLKEAWSVRNQLILAHQDQ